MVQSFEIYFQQINTMLNLIYFNKTHTQKYMEIEKGRFSHKRKM